MICFICFKYPKQQHSIQNTPLLIVTFVLV